MKDSLKNEREYKFIKSSELRPILQTNPLWYTDLTVTGLIDEYIQSGKNESEQTIDWRETKREFIDLFANMLEEEAIVLGNEPEGFNDDDRWGGRFNPLESEGPDAVVMHHTNTDPNLSLEESIRTVEALGLLRLYSPIYKAGFNSKDGQLSPISSGHYRNDRQTFIGYHYLVRGDGSVIHTLDDSYTGFHAGDYRTNCRSIGIAIVDDLTNKEPSPEAINTIKGLVASYQPARILGHKEVEFRGKPVNTECPGNTWDSWKTYLSI